jgi:Ni/Co efflux regulator RcnB
MASYHLSAKTISRSHGRSATGAAAYRSGARIDDERTGMIHDYRRRRGVEASLLIIPDNAPDWASDRARLWNAAEQAETRKNSTVAREFEIALPAELDAGERHGWRRISPASWSRGTAAPPTWRSTGRAGPATNATTTPTSC